MTLLHLGSTKHYICFLQHGLTQLQWTVATYNIHISYLLTLMWPYCHIASAEYKSWACWIVVAPDLTSFDLWYKESKWLSIGPHPLSPFFSQRFLRGTCCLSRISTSHQKLWSCSSQLVLRMQNPEDPQCHILNGQHNPKLGEHPYHDVALLVIITPMIVANLWWFCGVTWGIDGLVNQHWGLGWRWMCYKNLCQFNARLSELMFFY